MWAALFTSQVKLRVRIYLTTAIERIATLQGSFQQYLGTRVGIKKHSTNFRSLKYLKEITTTYVSIMK